MDSGQLNKRILIQYPTKTRSASGAEVLTWNDLCTIWAAIWPISASETIQAQAETMVISHRIRIRYRSVLRPSWRLKYGDKYFAIVSILNQNMANEFLDLMCKEAAA